MEKKKKETQMSVYELKPGGGRGDAEALDQNIAQIEVTPYVLHQYEVWHQAKSRLGCAKTKDRSEVSGGGKKPWRQKGTGRARHGSIRSPLWIKGGVTFGPRPRDYSYPLARKIKQQALAAGLQLKAAEEKLLLVDEFAVRSGKTKECSQFLADRKLKKPLFVTLEPDKMTVRAARNIPGVHVVEVRNVCAHDVLYCDECILTRPAYARLAEKFETKKTNAAEEEKK